MSPSLSLSQSIIFFVEFVPFHRLQIQRNPKPLSLTSSTLQTIMSQFFETSNRTKSPSMGDECRCSLDAPLMTSWTDANPGCRFYMCGMHKVLIFNISSIQSSLCVIQKDNLDSGSEPELDIICNMI